MPLEIGQIILSVFGTGVFAGLVIWGLLNHSWLWRSVAAAYPRSDARPAVREKMLDSIVIAKRPGPALGQKVAAPFCFYAGAMLSVVDGGLLLSRLPLFNILCPPIYLPFAGMTISPTFWALWPEPAAIRMKLLPDTDIILGQKTAQWLREHKI